MEFPEVGTHCGFVTCGCLDFLPFTCSFCKVVFCKEHIQPAQHSCSSCHDNVTPSSSTLLLSVNEKPLNYLCGFPSCRETSSIEMQCEKCHSHFCISHRYHQCYEINPDARLKELRKWQVPKEEYAKAKAIVDREITNRLKKSKNMATANKVQLMRIKGKATGNSKIPTSDRRYFLAYPPINGLIPKNVERPKAVFVDIHWTLGRTVDFLVKSLKLHNIESSNTEKLQIFHHNTGHPVCERLDVTLVELFENNDLIDGETIILEYSNGEPVDVTLYE
ncbi:AN1-type zinc finger protein 1 [Orussus abietinus]|uniref:AN1-type zinc finger protein 1 n=1 Tax=Orussus abietinus TaxID=222816 RepID=UPI0006265940|nr:AN1-type zinc finger protein 1 [Orussus abietinus]